MAFPGSRQARQFYLSLVLRIIGRAVQSASGIDPDIRREVSSMPEACTLKLSVWPRGSGFTLRKTDAGTLRLVSPTDSCDAQLHMEIQAPALGFALFTCSVSSALAASKGMITAYGRLDLACSLVSILNRTELYLLPRPIALRAVKRYESPPKKHRRRLHVLLRTLIYKPAGSAP